jgi:hypothetical protein
MVLSLRSSRDHEASTTSSGNTPAMSTSRRDMNDGLTTSASTSSTRSDSSRRQRMLAAAPRMAHLLLRLEEEAYADARPCPFCNATDAANGSLPHAVDCELDEVLFEAGLRLGPPVES